MASYESCSAHRTYVVDCYQCRTVTSAYRDGLAAGEARIAEAVAEERARVVAYFRNHPNAQLSVSYGLHARSIEAGEHVDHLTTTGASGKGEK